MKILLDNGHGQDTPGKRSPDGFFREYAYTRFLASQILEQLIRSAEFFGGRYRERCSSDHVHTWLHFHLGP